MDLKRWLAVGAGFDTVRLIPVPAPSAGPDVFCKLADVEALAAAQEAEIAELRKKAARWDWHVEHNPRALLAAAWGASRAACAVPSDPNEATDIAMRTPASAPTVSAG